MIKFDQYLFILSSSKLNASHVRTTTFKRILSGENSIIVYWSLPFHVAFVELENPNDYFISMQQSIVIERTLNSSDRCLNINELFNETFLLRRIKFYHFPCQKYRSELKCFYDEIHFCLCQQVDQEYVTNCFEFDHNMSFDCSGQSGCENGGQCFQEYPYVNVVNVIMVQDVNFQQMDLVFHLMLFLVIINISHQPLPVLLSLILTVIITFFGLVNGILSFITFKNRRVRESGCGIYLFSSSIIDYFFISFIFPNGIN